MAYIFFKKNTSEECVSYGPFEDCVPDEPICDTDSQVQFPQNQISSIILFKKYIYF